MAGAQEDSSYNRIKTLVNEELKQYFRPEFLNRLDEIIVFRQLSEHLDLTLCSHHMFRFVLLSRAALTSTCLWLYTAEAGMGS